MLLVVNLLPKSKGRFNWWKYVSLVWWFLLLSATNKKTFQCNANGNCNPSIEHTNSLQSTVEKWKNEMHSKWEIVSSVCWHNIIEKLGIGMEGCHQTHEKVSKYSILKFVANLDYLIQGSNKSKNDQICVENNYFIMCHFLLLNSILLT